MRAWAAAALLGLMAAGAGAERDEPVTVIDASTIEVAGERLRLYGIGAPPARAGCGRGDARWPCGREAASALERRIGTGPIACAERGRNRAGEVEGVCFADGGAEINAWLVSEGWALASGERYARLEARARALGKGLWRGGFEPPEAWGAPRALAAGEGGFGCDVCAARKARLKESSNAAGGPAED